MSTFQETKNNILQTFLNNTFIPDFKNGSVDNDFELELIISPFCNEHCSYCYIANYGRELFEGCDLSKENILSNLERILSCVHKNYKFNTISIFSGEFFNLSYWTDIFDIFIKYAKKNKFCNSILIPTNATFLLDSERTKKVETYIELLKSVGIRLGLSLSIDGKIIDKDARTLDAGEDFYNRAFQFAYDYHYGFHPMVSKEFVENFKENYEWWLKNLSPYLELTNEDRINMGLMLLEVRNDYWDEELIKKYYNGILEAAELDFKYLHHNSTLDFTDRFFHITDKWKHWNYHFISFPFENHRYTCSIQRSIQLRVADNAVVMCHRLQYPGMVAAILDFDSDEIKVKEAKNIDLFFKIKTTNPAASSPKCYNCPIRDFCMKGCLGSQYESSGELFNPIDSVCSLLKERYRAMNAIGEKYGLYDSLKYFNLSDKNLKYINKTREILCKI